MDATIYINTDLLSARASLTSAAAPIIEARMQAHLKLRVYFFATSASPAPLASPTFRVALKDAATPSGSVLALISTPTATGSDYYDFAWNSIDSTAMRALMADLDSVSVILEVEWTVASVIERVSIPITLRNAWIRTTDTAPDPVAEEVEAWLTARAVRFDAAQSLTSAQLTRALANLGITITATGYLQLTNADGDHLHVGLNTGSAPT